MDNSACAATALANMPVKAKRFAIGCKADLIPWGGQLPEPEPYSFMALIVGQDVYL
jgi:hypothetical protein